MSTAVRRYSRGRKLVSVKDEQAGTTRYYHYDHQGTVQCLTDGTGAVTDRFAGDAWGVQVKRTGTSINRHWYIGRSGYYRDAASRWDIPQRGSLCSGASRLLSPPSIRSGISPFPGSQGSGYAYVGNAPASRIVAGGRTVTALFQVPQYSDYVVDLLSALPPRITDCCGGANWRVSWTLKQHDPPHMPPNPNVPVFGYILQEVRVKGMVETCDGKPVPFPNGCTYIEAFRYDHTKGPPYDDYFGWRPTEAPTRGWWEITGSFAFVQADRLPPVTGGKWTIGGDGPCPGWSAGDLPFTLGDVDAFYLAWGRQPANRRQRTLRYSWECDPCVPNVCVTTGCSWSPHEPRVRSCSVQGGANC